MKITTEKAIELYKKLLNQLKKGELINTPPQFTTCKDCNRPKSEFYYHDCYPNKEL